MLGVTRARKEIAPDSRLAATKFVSAVERDGLTVLMDLRSGKYYGLDEVGARIWSLVLRHSTPAEILATVEREYDCDAVQLRADATAFLMTLLTLKLIRQ